jgi:hypothetical protein
MRDLRTIAVFVLPVAAAAVVAAQAATVHVSVDGVVIGAQAVERRGGLVGELRAEPDHGSGRQSSGSLPRQDAVVRRGAGPGAVPPAAGEAGTPTGGVPASQEGAARPLTLEQAVSRAGQYVLAYGEALAAVIGTERYTQWVQNDDFLRPVSRQLVAEFALLRVKDDWLGFRDVYEVDGKSVSDRSERLVALLRQRTAAGIEEGRRISDESARHNIGAIQRTFNVPTTALFFLQPANQARFQFTSEGEDRVAGREVWRIGYEEVRRPTIIRTSAGQDVPVRGQFWLDPADGRVFKTTLEISLEGRLGPQGDVTSDPGGFGEVVRRPLPGDPNPAFGPDRTVRSSASVTVTYREEARLGILVPAEMVEEYRGPGLSRFTGRETVTRITGRATYSDFKRFETSGRVVKH